MTKLQQEIACYEANRAKLVEEHPDEYVLIRGQKIEGFFTSETAAIKEGYRRFAGDPFLVRVCTEAQTPVLFTSLYLGR